MENKRVRVRFAPSPTGSLHLGGIRTALYNYLFAKKHGGDFILRIEDTDTARFVPGAEQYIIDSLKWCGIEPNEGVGFGDGQHAPYRQSERKHIYKEYIDLLVEMRMAYYAFDTPEELDAARKTRPNFMYNALTRDSMRNNISLSSYEVMQLIDDGVPYVIRFKMPRNEDVVVNDKVRGKVKVSTNTLDDKVLYKSDGMPTYHLASVVDDHLMEITHVIRGEEWLPSAPLHVLMYKAFGWEAPEFCHLSLILGPNGKLSKRDMLALGFPAVPLNWTDPVTGELYEGYRELGFLPEAFLNMLAVIGWSPGNNVEMMTMDDMIKLFSFEKVSKAGGQFNPKKAEWYSAQWMKTADNDRLAELFRPTVDEKLHGSPMSPTDEYLKSICGLLKEKVPYLSKFWENGEYFFDHPTNFAVLDDLRSESARKFLVNMVNRLREINDTSFDVENTKMAFNVSISDSGIEPREAGKVLRAAVCGNKVGPPIFDIMVVIRKTTVVHRIIRALNHSKVGH